jgi:hypothetical protein
VRVTPTRASTPCHVPSYIHALSREGSQGGVTVDPVQCPSVRVGLILISDHTDTSPRLSGANLTMPVLTGSVGLVQCPSVLVPSP